jgi:hypothetical protein
MNPRTRLNCLATVVGISLLAGTAQSQVSSINSAVIQTRVFNDIPLATVVSGGTYPSSLAFVEVGVSASSGFANRDVWRFSADSINPYTFKNNEAFTVSMDLTLGGIPATPRKEAGFLLNSIGGDGQFIVNTDGHEVVAFGGPFPFYAFPKTFDSGETIKLGMKYSWDAGNNQGSIVYTADGVSSPPLPFTNLEKGIIDGSTLGGYFQIVNDPMNSMNAGFATYNNIAIEAIPEPGTLPLLAVGILALWKRLRH